MGGSGAQNHLWHHGKFKTSPDDMRFYLKTNLKMYTAKIRQTSDSGNAKV